MVKKKSVLIFKFIISILFLIFLFYYIKPAQIIAAIGKTNPLWLLFALLLLPLNLFMQSVRWKFLAKLSKEKVTNKEIILSILYSFSYSIFTPGRLGEIGRAFHIADSKRDEMVVLAFYEKFFAFCSLMLFGLISLSFYRSFYYLIAVVAVLILMSCSKYVGQHIPYLKKFSEVLQKVHTAKIFLVSLLFVFVYISQFYLILNAFKPVNIFSAFFFISIVMLVNAVPITFSGLGLRELVSVYFFKQLYITSSQAASASLLLFFINILIPTFIGFILHLLPTKVNIAGEQK
ncbi:MAG TPA: flippase-like domain-containing protein [Candidatus Cloacimonetes bacterium]|nr:flippase-like domain-containing protein [Candidatus Cloacimonadota bacterium]